MNLIKVQTRLFDLLPLAAIASFGGPLVMTGADLYSNLERGISVNPLFSIGMFFVTYVYSLVATYILVGFTWFIAKLLSFKAVNVLFASIAYLIALLGWVYFDPDPIVPLGFMAMMAFPNAFFFVFLSRYWGKFTINKIAP
jgi:hypothetical protein